MGYETELIFVSGYKKTKEGRICGYQSVEATLEMGKCASGAFGELLKECGFGGRSEKTSLIKEVEQVESMHKELFTSDGDYTEEMKAIPNEADKSKRCAPYYKAKEALEKKLPYFFKDGNTELFMDAYGSLLMVASLEDVKKAIVKSNAQEIISGNYELGYRRFNIALRMIEAFEQDFGEAVQVILYGH